MFIEVNDNNGTKYLRLVESKRAFTKSGKPTCKKNIIFTGNNKKEWVFKTHSFFVIKFWLKIILHRLRLRCYLF